MARDVADDTYYAVHDQSTGGKIPVKWRVPDARALITCIIIILRLMACSDYAMTPHSHQYNETNL